jgi:hypothetical protein
MLQIRHSKSPKTPPWVRFKEESINGIKIELSALSEIKIDEMQPRKMQ